MPDIPRLRVQTVHRADVARAYRLAILGPARGAFNIAADPVLDPAMLAAALGARRVPIPARVARAMVDVTWRLRLQPTPPGWLDLALGVPLMDCSRARERLGWRAERSSTEALREILEGTADGADGPTPPLSARGSATGTARR